MPLDPQAERLAQQRADRDAAAAAIPPLEPPWPWEPRPFDPFFFGLEKTPVPTAPDPPPAR
ncbi:MAG TPA: hypothetical protein VGO11_19565 [Chthoniobacteraceae bacterium]|jgi:hypothetical protein|nr:hypothetical protein [Chthoniobacteraceae bacterium]